MSILKSIKEWLFPRTIIHDPFGEYVKRKQEKYLVDKINPQDIQKYFKKAGFVKVEPCKEIKRGEIALPGHHTKEKCKMSSDNYNEAGDPTKQEGLTDWIKGQKSAESLYVSESSQGYSTDEFINRDKKSDKEASIIYSYDAILKQNRKLKLEILEVKQEVDYYKKYIDFLEENYILVLKSPSTLKEVFDEMVGDKK